MRKISTGKFLSPLAVLLLFAAVFAALLAVSGAGDEVRAAELQAGAALVDISPAEYPVIVNGMFTERTADKAFDPLHARCLVLADGRTKLAIVVVDSCGVMREYLDDAKERASRATGIPVENMLISATHCHSAPSAWPALGSRIDPKYVPHLVQQIAHGIELAHRNLVPAQIGYGAVEDYEHDFCRRWILRPDKVREDPFGQLTVRATMNPGFQNPDFVGPTGPIDPDVTVLSVQTKDGRPLALLANYAMHYFGAPLLSGDYFAVFADEMAARLNATDNDPPFVGIMSQGTSGDSHWRDYSRPEQKQDIATFSREMADVAMRAYDKIEHRADIDLAMLETRITLQRRVPDAARWAGAEQTVAALGDRLPQTLPEVYAVEQQFLRAEPRRELKLQVIRIGEFGIAAWPNEVFNLSGLKVKAHSPLPLMMNITLANGAEGYIPPLEQHRLGGYTTWAARSAGLEVGAEGAIVERLLSMAEKVSGKSRRQPAMAEGAYGAAVRAARPLAYWRLNEMQGPRTTDVLGNLHGQYDEDGVVFFLAGVSRPGFDTHDRGNRAAQFAGGALRANVPKLPSTYSVEFWFYNGLSPDVRDVAGYLFAREEEVGKAGERLGIAGKSAGEDAGKLMLTSARPKSRPLFGKTPLQLRHWHCAVLTRDDKQLRVYLDGSLEIEIAGAEPVLATQLTFGGALGEDNRFFGKLDEAAVYDRVLSPEEIAAHYSAAQMP